MYRKLKSKIQVVNQYVQNLKILILKGCMVNFINEDYFDNEIINSDDTLIGMPYINGLNADFE